MEGTRDAEASWMHRPADSAPFPVAIYADLHGSNARRRRDAYCRYDTAVPIDSREWPGNFTSNEYYHIHYAAKYDARCWLRLRHRQSGRPPLTIKISFMVVNLMSN